MRKHIKFGLIIMGFVGVPMLLCWGIGTAIGGWTPSFTTSATGDIPAWAIPVGAGVVMGVLDAFHGNSKECES